MPAQWKKSLGFALGALLIGATALAADETNKPIYGAWGFDLDGADFHSRPGNDFFRYANGTWLDKTQIPSDKPAYSLRLQMTDRTEGRLHDMMEAAAAQSGRTPASLEGKVGAFYHAFMDEARVEKLGAAPIAPELNSIKAAKTRDELAVLMGKGSADFEPSIFGLFFDIDVKDPNRYAAYVSQSGLGLPDRDYYLKADFSRQKDAYQAYISKMLHLAGWADADARAKDVIEFETAIADASWTRAQDRDPVATYNPTDVKDLPKLAPGFNWKGFLSAAGVSRATRVIVAEKSAFPKIAAIYSKTPIATIQAWEAFHVADNAAPYLSSAFADAWFEMHDKTLAGQQVQRARWKRAVTAVAGGDFGAGDRFGTFGTLGFGVGQMYAAQYFPPSSKAKIEELVGNLKAAFRLRLQKLDWMSDATKAEALKKLDTYNIKVGYPDHPRDYSGVAITNDDLVGDVRAAAAADWAFYSGRIYGPVDKSDWLMTPQTNDAYNGSLRDIVFPAGILQAPIFDANADPAINYGAIGGVIGHEMTHGFDDQGRQFDASGALHDWWTQADADTFKARAKVLGEQYSAFEPLPGVHVQGDLTMGENIADLGGLTIALDAYHAYLNGKPAPVINGLTGDQRVFLGWAQAWRGKVTDDYVRKQVVSDPHSPRQFRVNGVVRNIDAWYAAFGVKPGDALYVAPDKRVHIW